MTEHTVFACSGCPYTTRSEEKAREHQTASKHGPIHVLRLTMKTKVARL